MNFNRKTVIHIRKVHITYLISKKYIIIDIQTIQIKLLHYEVNIKKCVYAILEYFLLDGNKSDYNMKVFVHNTHLNFNHKNSIQLHLKNCNYNSNKSVVYVDTLQLKSCKKNILTIHNIVYTTINDSIINIDNMYIELYKTTLYKLRLSIDFLIKKTRSPITKKNATILLNKFDHLQQIIDTDYIDNINDAHKEYVQYVQYVQYAQYAQFNKKHTLSKSIKKLNININLLHIKLVYKQKYITNVFHSVSYTKYSKIMYNIQVKQFKMIDHNNKVYIQKKFNVNNKIDVTFKNNFLNIFICPLEINLDFDILKDVIHIVEENMIDLKKLLYYEYVKNNYKEYFIHHLFIHTILIDISYYPKKSSLYKNLFSNKKEYSIYNITNYKHIQLSTKEIDIYYPLSTNNLLKKITKIWLQDIYTHQIKNIMRGIKYTKPLPITYDFSSKIIKNIKIMLKTSVKYLDS